jgi:hypothetical protein
MYELRTDSKYPSVVDYNVYLPFFIQNRPNSILNSIITSNVKRKLLNVVTGETVHRVYIAGRGKDFTSLLGELFTTIQQLENVLGLQRGWLLADENRCLPLNNQLQGRLFLTWLRGRTNDNCYYVFVFFPFWHSTPDKIT